MANKRKIGATGLSILEIDTSSQPAKKKTAQEVAKWVAALPTADTGAAAKKLFIMQTEISNTEMTAQERFAIMEELRTPNKVICTSLKRHYIEQRAPLTENKLIIANLRHTLLTAMADNYKLILEELHRKQTLTPEETLLMATSIARIYYYLNVILIARYQLYTYPPENVWYEIYLLYKYAKQRNILELRVPEQFSPNNKQTSVLETFMRIILMYAIDPYQWRQREQHSLNKAIEMWSIYPTIYDVAQIPADKTAGIYIMDLDQDEPPTLYSFKKLALTPTCVAVNLEKNVQRLKEILEKMKVDHLKAKIENPNDPEFTVTIPTIEKLINIWSQQIIRSSPRYPIQAQINIVFGLTAAHYYVNNEKEFNAHPANLRTNVETNAVRQLSMTHLAQAPELMEVSVEEEGAEPEKLSSQEGTAETEPEADEKTAAEEAEDKGLSKELLYHIYNYNIENINPTGFCIVIRDNSYPPFQAGEIVAFKNVTEHAPQWGIGSVRWLRRLKNEAFQIGIQILAPYAKAAGIQMLREDKPAGRLLRCLILPENKESQTPPMLITTAFPVHASSVLLYTDEAEPITATLNKEIDASGMYYQYVYNTSDGAAIIAETAATVAKKAAANLPEPEEEKTHTEFDKIWGDL